MNPELRSLVYVKQGQRNPITHLVEMVNNINKNKKTNASNVFKMIDVSWGGSDKFSNYNPTQPALSSRSSRGRTDSVAADSPLVSTVRQRERPMSADILNHPGRSGPLEQACFLSPESKPNMELNGAAFSFHAPHIWNKLPKSCRPAATFFFFFLSVWFQTEGLCLPFIKSNNYFSLHCFTALCSAASYFIDLKTAYDLKSEVGGIQSTFKTVTSNEIVWRIRTAPFLWGSSDM